MFSFIIQLLIISVVGLMVQSAPVTVTDDHLHKRSTKESKRVLEKSLFCAATSLHFDDLFSNFTVPAAPQISSNTHMAMRVTYDNFSTLCKNFTIAMSLKYQVQDLLFNNDTTPELTDANIQNLTKILINLQTMATALDNIHFYRNNDHSRCLTLTAAQYRIMYYVLQLKATFKQALEDITKFWILISGDYEHTNLHPGQC